MELNDVLDILIRSAEYYYSERAVLNLVARLIF